MALVEQFEDIEQRFATEVSRDGARVTLRIVGGGSRNILSGVLYALDGVRSVSGLGGKASSTEHRTVREFAKSAGGAQRDVVDIGDKRVLAQIRHELRKAGVEFAVERQGKEHVLHFRAADSKVLVAALERATERVDRRIAEAGAKSRLNEAITERVQARTETVETAQRERQTPAREDDERASQDKERTARENEGDARALQGDDEAPRTHKSDAPSMEGPAVSADAPRVDHETIEAPVRGGGRR